MENLLTMWNLLMGTFCMIITFGCLEKNIQLFIWFSCSLFCEPIWKPPAAARSQSLLAQQQCKAYPELTICSQYITIPAHTGAWEKPEVNLNGPVSITMAAKHLHWTNMRYNWDIPRNCPLPIHTVLHNPRLCQRARIHSVNLNLTDLRQRWSQKLQ